MRRFFTEPENVDKTWGYIKIIEDASHIKNVLRMRSGDRISVFDGSGFEYEAELCELAGSEILARLISEQKSEYEPAVKVTLFQGIPKSGKLDVIVQKAVELGVYKVVPFRAERSVAQIPDDAKGRRKIERLNKIAKEAAKQCGRGFVPRVEAPVSVTEMSERLKTMDMSIMLYEELGHSGDRNLRSILKKSAENIGVIIGPEGGFATAEAERLIAVENVYPAGLGRRILRTETAGSTALSIIMYEKNEI